MIAHKYGAALLKLIKQRRIRPEGRAEIEYVKEGTFSTHATPYEFMHYNLVANILSFEFIGHGYCDAERYRIRYTCFEKP
jgi:hypothetical protein